MKFISVRTRSMLSDNCLDLPNSINRQTLDGVRVNTQHRSGLHVTTYSAACEDQGLLDIVIDVLAHLDARKPESFEITVRNSDSISESPQPNGNLANGSGKVQTVSVAPKS